MRTTWISIGGILLTWAALAGAANDDATTLLQKGLFEEEANHDLNAAVSNYQSVVAQFDAERKLAATAIFRLGECYRKQGNTNTARAQYNRVLQEFADQESLADLSRTQLAALRADQGANPSTADKLRAGREAAEVIAETAEVRRIQAMIKESPDLINAKDPTEGETPLHKAAAAGQLNVATFLLDNGADVDAKTPDRNGLRTPLHLAAQAGHKGMAELLLQHKANVNAVDSGGTTPLHLASAKGFRTVAEVLLAAGADVNAKNRTGGTPLHLATVNGFKSMAELLLQHGADVNASTIDVRESANNAMFSGTALDIAAHRGDMALTELLLTNKANPDAINQEGKTPLDFATEKRNLALAQLLLSHGANVNTSNPVESSRGWTPLAYAMPSEEMTSLLLKQGADPNVLFQYYHLQRVPNSSGSWNNNVSETAYTALLTATTSAWTNIVDLLLDAKADPNLKDKAGVAPIINAIYALDSGARFAMVKSLLEHGAHVEARDPLGRTPLMVAVLAEDKACLKLLLSYKAEVNAPDNEGLTALHYAAGGTDQPSPTGRGLTWRQGAMFNLTLARPGAYPSTPGTPATPGLRRAEAPPGKANAERGEIAELLLTQGADVNAIDTIGRTPLGLALEWPHPSYEVDPVPELLRKHGAVANLPDFSSMRIGRSDLFQPAPVFKRDTNALNHFTLFEVIANYYQGPIAASYQGPIPAGGISAGGTLTFPDLSRVKILRPVPRKLGERKEIAVNLLTDGSNLDCTKDDVLQFGDVVDLPEREHPLSESPVGLTGSQRTQLDDCLRRKVTFVVKGEAHPVEINGGNSYAYLSKALSLPGVQAILRSSSDLSQVHVRRKQPNGEIKEFTENVGPFWNGKEPLSNDLWLENGDIVDVPDRAGV